MEFHRGISAGPKQSGPYKWGCLHIRHASAITPPLVVVALLPLFLFLLAHLFLPPPPRVLPSVFVCAAQMFRQSHVAKADLGWRAEPCLCVFCVVSISATPAVEALSVGEEVCWGGEGLHPIPLLMCDWVQLLTSSFFPGVLWINGPPTHPAFSE